MMPWHISFSKELNFESAVSISKAATLSFKIYLLLKIIDGKQQTVVFALVSSGHDHQIGSKSITVSELIS